LAKYNVTESVMKKSRTFLDLSADPETLSEDSIRKNGIEVFFVDSMDQSGKVEKSFILAIFEAKAQDSQVQGKLS
jgi:hypothetical protein